MHCKKETLANLHYYQAHFFVRFIYFETWYVHKKNQGVRKQGKMTQLQPDHISFVEVHVMCRWEGGRFLLMHFFVVCCISAIQFNNPPTINMLLQLVWSFQKAWKFLNEFSPHFPEASSNVMASKLVYDIISKQYI